MKIEAKTKFITYFNQNSCLLLGNKYQRKNYPFFSLFPNAIKQKNVGLAFNKTGENRSKKLKKLVKTRFLRECTKKQISTRVWSGHHPNTVQIYTTSSVESSWCFASLFREQLQECSISFLYITIILIYVTVGTDNCH